MDIDTRELRRIFDRVITHIEESNGSTVKLDYDFFFSVPFPEIYAVDTVQHPMLTIGQLTESWANLRRTDEPGETIAFDAVWLGDLLKAIGHAQSE